MTAKKYLVGITDYVVPPPNIEEEGFPEAEFIFLNDWRSSKESEDQWRKVEALLVWRFGVEMDTVNVLDNCKIVVRYGVGYDNVNYNALAKRRIPFSNNPDYGTEEVADTACAMILACVRRILTYDRASRFYAKGWQQNTIKEIRRTSDITLGVIGVGRIGTAVVNRMKGFGIKILGYDPYQPCGHEKAVGYKRVETMDEILSQSDIITLHCPLTSETKGMMDADFFNKMKKGSSIVNTARGAILKDFDAIEQALKSGQLTNAALDVLPQEPPDKNHPLIRAWINYEEWISGRLIINPHGAYYSQRGFYEQRFKAAETARRLLVSGRLRNQIVPDDGTKL
jgi:phosphoglycerate dehydrogenase-like enzyme